MSSFLLSALRCLVPAARLVFACLRLCPYRHNPALHPPAVPVPQGQATDIMIRAQEIMRMKETLTGLYIKHTGCSREVAGACREQCRDLSLLLCTMVLFRLGTTCRL